MFKFINCILTSCVDDSIEEEIFTLEGLDSCEAEIINFKIFNTSKK